MNDKIAFGIIGGGMIASFHAAAIAAAEHAELAGVFDLNRASAERIAAPYGARVYASLEEMLADSGVRAVTIATPSGAHGAAVVAAARAGKHILCEKPLEVSREKMQEMLTACREAKVLLIPVFQTRFAKPVQRLREAVLAGRFGRMLFASAQIHWYRAEEYYAASGWRGTWRMDGGGALINQAIHTVDQLFYLNGPLTSVSAFAGTLTHKIEVEDTLCASLQFANGSFGTIEASTSCAPGFPRRLSFCGSRGSVILEEDRFLRWEFDTPAPEDESIRQASQGKEANAAGGSAPTNISCEGHTIQIEDLALCVQTGKRPIIDTAEGVRTMEAIFAIYDSVRSGKTFVLATSAK